MKDITDITVDGFAQQYYQLDSSGIESVSIKSAITFAERYAQLYHGQQLRQNSVGNKGPAPEVFSNVDSDFSGATEKVFQVQKLTNHRGDTHLVAIIVPAITDVQIGSVVIVPYAEGFQEPSKVMLQLDEKGFPKRVNGTFAVVNEYLYD